MIIKLFGLMDLLSAIVLILLKYNIGETIAYIFILYLFIKGLLFFGDFNSIMDIITAIIFVLAVQGHFFFFTWVFVFFLLQKAFFSLLG